MKCGCKDGKVFAHLNFGPDKPGSWEWITCPTCKGIGEVPDIWAEWRETGKRISYCMFKHELTLRTLSKKIGCDVVALSRARVGEEDPAPMIELIQKYYDVPEVKTCICGSTEFEDSEDEFMGQIIQQCVKCHQRMGRK
ncbi:MAG: hypothetical protein PQJ59_16815 [Spirochaetales bacterium]|nr:hypothetical protein [Spirochaetales bacterium]